jgi:hypothetical protein
MYHRLPNYALSCCSQSNDTLVARPSAFKVRAGGLVRTGHVQLSGTPNLYQNVTSTRYVTRCMNPTVVLRTVTARNADPIKIVLLIYPSCDATHRQTPKIPARLVFSNHASPPHLQMRASEPITTCQAPSGTIPHHHRPLMPGYLLERWCAHATAAAFCCQIASLAQKGPLHCHTFQISPKLFLTLYLFQHTVRLLIIPIN